MPKNRSRAATKGAKSVPVQTKNKIDGRKSGQGTNKMSNPDLEKALQGCRKKDRNKLTRAFVGRGLA